MPIDQQQRWKRRLEYDRRSMMAIDNFGTRFPGPGASGNEPSDEEAERVSFEQAQADEAEQEKFQEAVAHQGRQQAVNRAEAAEQQQKREREKKEAEAKKAAQAKKTGCLMWVASWIIPGAKAYGIYKTITGKIPPQYRVVVLTLMVGYLFFIFLTPIIGIKKKAEAVANGVVGGMTGKSAAQIQGSAKK